MKQTTTLCLAVLLVVAAQPATADMIAGGSANSPATIQERFITAPEPEANIDSVAVAPGQPALLFATAKATDVVKVFDLWCMRGWRQIPARLVYGATIVGLGLVVARGFQRTFDEPDSAAARMVPIIGRTF